MIGARPVRRPPRLASVRWAAAFRGVAAALVAAAALGATPTPARGAGQTEGGQTGGGPTGGGQTGSQTGGQAATSQRGGIEFFAQTPWVGADGQFGVRFTVVRPSGPSNLEVAVSVYPAVSFRSEFQETLVNRIFGDPVLPVAVYPLGGLTADTSGIYSVAVAATLGGQDGVHPVRVELRDRDDFDVLDEFVTHLLYLPGDHMGPKLGVSIVLPVHNSPAVQPDGTRRRPDDAELAGLSSAIDAARTLPVSFMPTPETVAALVASNDPRAGAVLTSLRQAVAAQAHIGGPYVPVSLPALTTAGLDGEVARQLNRGSATLTEVLRAGPESNLWVAEEPLDSASIDLLASQGIERVVATEAGLTPIPDQLVTLTGPFRLDGERRSVQGAAADAGLSAHFGGDGDRALQAAHFLADLAVLYLDLPGEQRGVVALAPRSWRVDKAFVDTVVAGLSTNPVVEAISLDTLFSTVPSATDLGEPLVRRPAVAPGGSLTGVVNEIRGVRDRLDALGSVLGPTNAVSGDLGERLLVAQSADFRSTRERDPYLDGVQQAISEQLGGIEMPQDRSITLTARRGEIPVTFQNHTGHPVKVVVHMESDKLDFPRGESLEIDLTRLNTTHRFPVVARTSGAFPIRITLVSPDGDLVVGRARLTVRSTATSGVGLGISLGAALFLAIWWGRHAQRGRRAKRLMEPSALLAPRAPRAPAPQPPVPAAAPASVTVPAAPAPASATASAPLVATPPPHAASGIARAEPPGATVLTVPLAPGPSAAVPAPPGPRARNGNDAPTGPDARGDDAQGDENENRPVPAPGTLGGG